MLAVAGLAARYLKVGCAILLVSGLPKVQCVTKSFGTGSAGLPSRYAVGPNIAHLRSNFVWITSQWKQELSEAAICVIVCILPHRPSNSISLLPVDFYILWGGYQSCDWRRSWNWLDSRCVKKIWKRNAFLRATLVNLRVTFNELYVHVSKEFSMWDDIERSQLRRGSWNWLDSGCIEKIRKRNTSLGGHLSQFTCNV